MADAFDQFETLLLENVDPAVFDLTLENDDPWWTLIDTFQPQSVAGRTTFSDEGTAGWEAGWRMRVQRAGLVTGGTFAGNTLEMMGKDDHMAVGQAADATYPDPAKVPMRSHIRVKSLLKRMKGNLTVNQQQIFAELVSEPLESVAMGHIEDVVSQVRQVVSAMGWSDGSALLAQVNSSSSISVDETAGGTATAVDVGTGLRFVKGQRYQAGSNVATANYSSSARSLRTGNINGVFRCVSVNPDTLVPSFESEVGEGTITLQDNDAIMLEGMYDFSAANVNAATRAPSGVENLLINSGNFPNTSLAVANYTGLQAFVSGSDDAKVDPTPELVATMVDKQARLGLTPSSVLVSDPLIKTLYSQLERQGGAVYNVPQAAGFVGGGGTTGALAQHNNTTFTWLTSSMVRPNSIVGLAPDTWKKFMPMGNKTIRWFYNSGTMAGAGSIFNPVHAGRPATELAQAPFDFFVEFGVTRPQRNFRQLGVKSTADVR